MTTELTITGMTCGHCVRAVREALEAVPGVTSARVDLANGKALVEHEADHAALVAAVQEEGYQVQP